MTGLWAASTYYGELRLKITSNEVVIAIKCGNSSADGVRVGAVATPSKVRMLASKSLGSSTGCGIKVTPVEVPACADNVGSHCFEVTGTTLAFWGTSLFETGGATSPRYTKLSD